MKKLITQFNGGIANNSKSGLQAAARFMRFLDIYTDADSVTLSPTAVRDDGGVVVDLITWAVDAQPYATDKYFLGNTGKVYKKTSGGVWSVDTTLSTGSPTGQGMAILNDFLYVASSTTIARKGPLSLSVGWTEDFLNDNVANLDLNITSSGQTFSVPTTITETATTKIPFIPTKDPLLKCGIIPTAKGTGNWTVTVHDASNNVLGTATIANGSLTNGTMAFFTVGPIRVINGTTYHLHVTSSVADGTLQTGTTADESTAAYQTTFGILVADTQYHQIMTQAGGNANTIVIGNERYLAQYDGVTYNPNKIVLEQGYKVRGITKQNEFAVAYSWKGSAIDNFEYGKLHYWDGFSPYFNYPIDVNQGMPNALVNTKTRLFGVFGSGGDLALATDSSSPFKQLQPLPQLGTGKTLEVLPGAIGVWQRRVRLGAWSSDDSTNFEAGIYEFGNQSDRAINWQSVSTESLNYFAKISTGTVKSTTLQIGCVFPAGKDLYVSWKDNTTYGIDKISKTNNPSPTGSYESLIIDEGYDVDAKQLASLPQKTKNAIKMVVTFAALPTGCTVTPKYRVERAASWTLGTAATAGALRAELAFNGMTGLRYREIEIGFDLTATVNYPVISSIYYAYDPLVAEVSES